jgi:hypothetical protein
MEPGGGTDVGAVESLLTSFCFHLPGLTPSPSPGSGGAELPIVPLAGPDCLSVSLCKRGAAVGVVQAALSFCQAGQWSGEVTAVTSALPGGVCQDKGVRPPLR